MITIPSISVIALIRLGQRIADLLVVQPGPPDRSRLERLAREHWRVDGLEPEAVRRLVDALERLLESTPLPGAEQGRHSQR